MLLDASAYILGRKFLVDRILYEAVMLAGRAFMTA